MKMKNWILIMMVATLGLTSCEKKMDCQEEVNKLVAAYNVQADIINDKYLNGTITYAQHQESMNRLNGKLYEDQYKLMANCEW